MTVNELMEQKKISKYKMAKSSGIPYTTLSDICSGKAQIEKCSAETVYKLAKELNISMESLLEQHMMKRIDFELYKSNVCHQVKEQGDINFITNTLEADTIRKYYQRRWYPESLYLLAMVDYLSRLNSLPICKQYNDLRRSKLSDVIYPSSVLTAALVSQSDKVKKQALLHAIPEFLRFNIIESEVRNVL